MSSKSNNAIREQSGLPAYMLQSNEKKQPEYKRTGTLPLNELDEERAEKEVEYRINSSTTIIEVSAVLGGFSFDRFMSCHEFEELFAQKSPKLFWWFMISIFLSFCLNM
eukprot:902053_1